MSRIHKAVLSIVAISSICISASPAMPAQGAAPSPPDPAHPRIMQAVGDQQRQAPVSPLSSAAPANAAPAMANTPKNLRREVFGFALAGSLSDPTVGYPSWNFSLLTTVAFFGLHINDDGTIASDSGRTVWDSSQLTGLVSTAHTQGTKVVVTVIEQDFAAGTPHMCAALANRATTVSQTVAEVAAKGVDGVNIDFEGLNGTCPNGQTARSMMSDFAQKMRAALPAGSYLSVDTYAGAAADSLGFFDVPSLSSTADALFVMAYDLEYSNYAYPPTSCASFCLGPTAPLTGYHYNDTTVVSQYLSVAPAAKILLGVPYYGRKSCVASPSANATPTGAVTADTYLDAISESSQPQVQSGSYVANRDANDPGGQERWDTWFNTTLNCTRELYWDDTVSLGKKYDLVNTDSIRGVGIWNLNYGGGASELWNSLYAHFAACSSATLAANPAYPQAPGAMVQLTASSVGCPSPEYRFFIQPPGGAWAAQTGYQGATWTWNTSNLSPGVYGIGVWVREAGVSTGYDAYYLGTYTLGYPVCSAATLSAGSAPPQPPGAQVAFTASAAGCSNAQFKFWLLAPRGSWTMQRDWGAANWTWDTTGLAPGTYRLGVWTRQNGSPNSYDVYAMSTFAIGTANCSAVTMSTAIVQPQPPGTTVGYTATSNGCTNPQYRFWLLPPGGTWSVQQSYGASTWNWNTSGLASGTYQIGVWVKQGGSTGAYDAYFIGTYQLEVGTCTSVTLAATPSSPQGAGTKVTVTGSAAGCDDPRYEFWLLPPPGTTWAIVQTYGTSNSWSWDTTGLAPGPYRVGVWARQNGSPNSYDTYSIVTFWLS